MDVLNEGNPGPGVQLTMNPRFTNFFESLWSRPDPVLADAGVAGELLVAKIRLSLATVLLLIPVINSLFFPVGPKEGLVGLSLTSGTFFLALTVYLTLMSGLAAAVMSGPHGFSRAARRSGAEGETKWRSRLDASEEIDEVAVRIAKIDGTRTPGLGCRGFHPDFDNSLQARVLQIDIRNVELQN